jgi:hypothetical protein
MTRKFHLAALGIAMAMAGAVQLTAPTDAHALNVRIPPKPKCTWKDDFLGGYHRLHAWCPGSQVTVSVRCGKGRKHTSAYSRAGYNKAECRVKRDGKIVDATIAGPPTPILPPHKAHQD